MTVGSSGSAETLLRERAADGGEGRRPKNVLLGRRARFDLARRAYCQLRPQTLTTRELAEQMRVGVERQRRRVPQLGGQFHRRVSGLDHEARTVKDDHAGLEAQAGANSRPDFVRHRDDLLIGAALSVSGDRDQQAVLLKAMLDDDDFRVRAGELIMGSIWDGYRSEEVR